MKPLFLQATRYSRILNVEDSESSNSDLQNSKEVEETDRQKEGFWASKIARYHQLFIIILAFIIGFGFLLWVNTLLSHTSLMRKRSCISPGLRQEWRTLDSAQKSEYIEAAQCLQRHPSKLHAGMSIYDDFPFLHDVIGDYAHETAPFLTWHRYFIHLYEMELKNTCGYSGQLPYWDWSLDSEDLSKSPVFESSLGFGGDSLTRNFSETAVVGGDRCLQDGPFAGLEVHWWTQEGKPHCLSRGFQDIVPIEEMGYTVSPNSIEKLLQEPDYEKLFLSMEHGAHNGIQIAIGGDLCYNAAPYDPIFYLHHASLDRLWWLWQQVHPSHQMEYLGPANNYSDARASLDDIIPMGDFAPGIAARNIMRTESDLLCYSY